MHFNGIYTIDCGCLASTVRGPAPAGLPRWNNGRPSPSPDMQSVYLLHYKPLIIHNEIERLTSWGCCITKCLCQTWCAGVEVTQFLSHQNSTAQYLASPLQAGPKFTQTPIHANTWFLLKGILSKIWIVFPFILHGL